MKSLLPICLIALSVVALTQGRKMNQCQVYKELLKHGFDRSKIADWVCLVMKESNGNTAAMGKKNKDGSIDYGLFQINGRYWCGKNKKGGGCNMDCTDLLDNNIADDVKCVRIIEKRHGLSGWVAWRNHCKGKKLPDLSRC